MNDSNQAVFVVISIQTLEIYLTDYKIQFEMDLAFPRNYTILHKAIIPHSLFSPKYRNIGCEIDENNIYEIH